MIILRNILILTFNDNQPPCIIAVPRWAGDSKRGNRRDAERSQRQEPTGLHRSRQVQPPVLRRGELAEG